MTLPTTSNTIQDTIQSDDLSRVIRQGIHASYGSWSKQQDTQDHTPKDHLARTRPHQQEADTYAETKESKVPPWKEEELQLHAIPMERK